MCCISAAEVPPPKDSSRIIWHSRCRWDYEEREEATCWPILAIGDSLFIPNYPTILCLSTDVAKEMATPTVLITTIHLNTLFRSLISVSASIMTYWF